MRVYYIFNINKYFSYIYKNKPYKIYKMLEETYHVKEYDVVLTYKLYEQIAVPFNKNNLNDYITNSYEGNSNYYKKSNIHIISNNFEYSKLVIGNANLKIKTNINYPTFFERINNYNSNIFICDFQNSDYFWLEKIIKKDGQNTYYEVK
jgi:hypothetical protein